MRSRVSIADGLPGDNRDETVGTAIDTGGAYAAAGGQAGDDQTAIGGQRRGQALAKKGADILFGNDQLIVSRYQPVGPRTHRMTGDEIGQRRYFLRKPAPSISDGA